MSKRFAEIAGRKQALIDKARLERLELAAAAAQIRSPFNLGRTFSRFVGIFGAYPLAAAGISSFVLAGFGRKLFRCARLIFRFRQTVLPLWVWWVNRRHS